jgi:hypothetical protein
VRVRCWDSLSQRANVRFAGRHGLGTRLARRDPDPHNALMEAGEVLVPRTFLIISHEACVVAATVACQHCRAPTEVICIHCFGGTVAEEPLEQFTVSDVQKMDEPLASQLALWPSFRKRHDSDGVFANFCSSCGEPQDDMRLLSEPGQPFFDVPAAITAGQVTCTPLLGTIRLNGDEHHVIE